MKHLLKCLVDVVQFVDLKPPISKRTTFKPLLCKSDKHVLQLQAAKKGQNQSSLSLTCYCEKSDVHEGHWCEHGGGSLREGVTRQEMVVADADGSGWKAQVLIELQGLLQGHQLQVTHLVSSMLKLTSPPAAPLPSFPVRVPCSSTSTTKRLQTLSFCSQLKR